MHFGASLLALQSLTPWRGDAVKWMARVQDDAVAAIIAPLVAGFCFAFPLILGGLVLWGLVALASFVWPHAGGWYLDQLLALATVIAGP